MYNSSFIKFQNVNIICFDGIIFIYNVMAIYQGFSHDIKFLIHEMYWKSHIDYKKKTFHFLQSYDSLFSTVFLQLALALFWFETIFFPLLFVHTYIHDEQLIMYLTGISTAELAVILYCVSIPLKLTLNVCFRLVIVYHCNEHLLHDHKDVWFRNGQGSEGSNPHIYP